LNFALQGVAHRAAHIFVGPSQGELSALIVVKGGGGPSLVYVAIGAFRHPIFGGKLGAMGVSMAGFTLLRSAFELNIMGTREDLVTIGAPDRPMAAGQCEFRLRMVEAGDVDPGLSDVACLASQGGAISPFGSLAFLKFPLVRVRVAGCASGVFEVEWQNLVGSSIQAGFMAIRAGDGHVCPSKHIFGLLVLGYRKGRAVEVLYGVALLATVLIGSGRKLFVMFILMAICASREFYLVEGVLPGWHVAFIAIDSCMFALEGVFRRGVFLDAKQGRLPSVHIVALGAFAFARPRHELTLVWIGGMAIDALCKCDLLFEVACLVTLIATDLRMHPQQRVFRFRMVELLLGHIDLMPTVGRMAGLACRFEFAFVRVRMACGAGVELHALVLHGLFIAGWKVALFANHFGVRAGQGVSGLGMIELVGLFPVHNIVAALAIRAKLAFVHILVAGLAILRKAHVGMGQINLLN